MLPYFYSPNQVFYNIIFVGLNVVEWKKLLSYTRHKKGVWAGYLTEFFHNFSHGSQSALNRLLHSRFTHPLGHSDLSIALAENHTGIYPAALHFRQRIERSA